MKRTSVDMVTARELELPLPLERHRLEASQLHLLQRTIAKVKENSPFYRSHLQHILPHEILRLDDLSRLPFLSPTQLVSAGDRLLSVSQTEIKRVVSLPTSGSTGQPKQIHYTETDLEATRQFFYYGMQSLINDSDKVLVLLPYVQENSVGCLLQDALSRASIDCAGFWPVQAAEAAVYAAEHSITCLVGLPQHLLEVAHYLATAGKNTVRTMLLCSDYVPSPLRKRIETLCRAETFLHWGATETGLGGAVECCLHDGCHVRESQLLLEIIDPETGWPRPEGELGEIVVTTIARQGTVLLRYRTGDFGTLSTSLCQCGGTTARLTMILGKNVRHTIGKGTISSQELDEALFTVHNILDFRAELSDFAGYSSGQLKLYYRTAPHFFVEEEEIILRLRNVDAIKKAEKDHELKLVTLPITDLNIPNHTFKRSISDNRSRKNQCT